MGLILCTYENRKLIKSFMHEVVHNKIFTIVKKIGEILARKEWKINYRIYQCDRTLYTC
jgi:hypothetical protein